jgi:rubrerythrin
MPGETLEIKTSQGLLQALMKAKKIEEAFEEVLHWQGFLTVQDEEAGRILEILVRDSASHERLVDSLIKMVGPLSPPLREMRSAPIVIDGDDEVEFLRKLLEGEDTAYLVYSTILDALTRIDSRSLGGEPKVAEMRRVLGMLVSAERRHREIVSKLLAGRIST